LKILSQRINRRLDVRQLRERLNVFNHVDLHDAYKCERRRKAISSLSLFSLSLSILLSPPLFLWACSSWHAHMKMIKNLSLSLLSGFSLSLYPFSLTLSLSKSFSNSLDSPLTLSLLSTPVEVIKEVCFSSNLRVLTS